MNELTTARREVRYRGRVQGVGFRYTAQRIARGFQVTGYVRNLPDGTVELVAEGAAPELDQFLADVQAAMDQNISAAQVHCCPAQGGYAGFEIRF